MKQAPKGWYFTVTGNKRGLVISRKKKKVFKKNLKNTPFFLGSFETLLEKNLILSSEVLRRVCVFV